MSKRGAMSREVPCQGRCHVKGGVMSKRGAMSKGDVAPSVVCVPHLQLMLPADSGLQARNLPTAPSIPCLG